ncbi:DcrB family lipoprotein [Biostraticola tofi]|uniref:Inner membrane lipoprotein DcrB n=1 Tax=Biostraticola tofi TaxID=466109 RepID=A0A4R3YT06_9GAMM|nr:DcrB family lipoprotein [Biostraticola tofi]TCV95620.1 uncharacterized protein DUF1795 [Biostraticola tofi]
MRNVAKYLGIGMLVLGLAGCDNSDSKGSGNTSGAAQATQNVTLLDGKLAFSLPADMADQSGKVGTQANNMHVYADESGRKAVIVILGDNTTEGLDVLAQRLEDQQRARDPDLQVITNKAITANGQPLQQLDSIISSGGKQAYSSVVIGKVAEHLLTMQITLPADNQQTAQSAAETIINTVNIK